MGPRNTRQERAKGQGRKREIRSPRHVKPSCHRARLFALASRSGWAFPPPVWSLDWTLWSSCSPVLSLLSRLGAPCVPIAAFFSRFLGRTRLRVASRLRSASRCASAIWWFLPACAFEITTSSTHVPTQMLCRNSQAIKNLFF